MNQDTLIQFESRLYTGSALEESWKELLPDINDGKVYSRKNAYVLFSKMLQTSQLAMQQENLQKLWINLLGQASFSLCIENNKPISYRFHTIIELLESGKEAFDVNIVEVDGRDDELFNMSKAIDSIALSSLGDSPGPNLFHSILATPNTLCLLVKERENYIACSYGSYLEGADVKFFHLNFLGRKIEYPSIYVVKKLQEEGKRIKDRFPQVQYLTLCVSASNDHMIPIYKDLGFVQLEYIEVGFKNKPTYFFAKKIDEKTNAKPPSYHEYKEAAESQRKLPSY